MRTPAKYVWPASALTASDMALLHAVRETSETHVTITGLIASAVRTAYGQSQIPTQPPTPTKLSNKETHT